MDKAYTTKLKPKKEMIYSSSLRSEHTIIDNYDNSLYFQDLSLLLQFPYWLVLFDWQRGLVPGVFQLVFNNFRG